MKCSNRCAKPVRPGCSWREPTMYQMLMATTGARWSGATMTRRPLSRRALGEVDVRQVCGRRLGIFSHARIVTHQTTSPVARRSHGPRRSPRIAARRARPACAPPGRRRRASRRPGTAARVALVVLGEWQVESDRDRGTPKREAIAVYRLRFAARRFVASMTVVSRRLSRPLTISAKIRNASADEPWSPASSVSAARSVVRRDDLGWPRNWPRRMSTCRLPKVRSSSTSAGIGDRRA